MRSSDEIYKIVQVKYGDRKYEESSKFKEIVEWNQIYTEGNRKS